MRTFRVYAPIIGAGALMLSVLLPAPLPLKAEDQGVAAPAPVKNAAPSRLGELKTNLSRSDRIVALQALKMALTELGDGATLVWRRPASQLTGRVKPVSAFRDGTGRICRTVIYALARGAKQKQIEGIACREADGRWTIIG